MPDERAALDAVLAEAEAALSRLLGARLVADLVARVKRAGRGNAGGAINPVGRQALAEWLPTAIAALFGASPADAEALYATPGTVPYVLALSTQLAAHTAVQPVVADVTARLAGQPGALAAVTGAPVTPRPLIFDPARTWVDPQGYKLSDRLWAAGGDVRAAIDTLLDYHIQAGSSAPTIAKELTQYLTPEGLVSRTATPYGRSNGIYAPLRLARTETTRTYGAATVQAAAVNPFVTGIAWKRSASHVGQDECDLNATRDDHGLGAGVYPVDKVPTYPNHPQDKCYLSSVVRDDTEAVIAAIMRGEVPGGLDAEAIVASVGGFAE